MIFPPSCSGVSHCQWSPGSKTDPMGADCHPADQDLFEANPWPQLDLMPGPRAMPWSVPGCMPGGSSSNPQAPPTEATPQPVQPKKARKPKTLGVRPEKQPDRSACGQTSVAMTLRYLTGKPWTASQVASRYGYGLKTALQQETSSLGLTWKDRNFSPRLWGTIEEKLKLGRPVIMGLNGPDFSPSGRGHIITLTGIQGDTVSFVDPASGKQRQLPRSAFEKAPGHPQGKFVFYAVKSH